MVTESHKYKNIKIEIVFLCQVFSIYFIFYLYEKNGFISVICIFPVHLHKIISVKKITIWRLNVTPHYK